MRRFLILLGFLAGLGKAHAQALPELKERILVDPKTKFTVRIEADQCHIGGLTTAGVLLWRKNLFLFARGHSPHIEKFEVNDGQIIIDSHGGGFGSRHVTLDERTGRITGDDSL